MQFKMHNIIMLNSSFILCTIKVIIKYYSFNTGLLRHDNRGGGGGGEALSSLVKCLHSLTILC